MEVLSIDRLTAGYGQAPIVREVTLGAAEATVTALIGPNGAGKSTLFKAVAGLIPLLSGRVLLRGLDIARRTPERIAASGVAYVPQVNNVFPTLSVAENLEMGAYLREAGLRDRMEAVLDVFPDLRIAARRRAGQLSGGQRTMLAIAMALMLDPAVLLLDEPTAGLAPAFMTKVWETVRAIAGRGTPVIVVEQNVDLAVDHADWVYVLVGGRNRLDGPAARVRAEDLSAVFLGQSGGEDEAGSPARR